ncbi:MAG: superoxide dismutase family protein [Ruminococcaceae bacterium]|nr:superoxide dismutase family protein [Oscillospiraceae bacterium]
MFKNSILNIKVKPYAFARIKGSNDYPHIDGIVFFYKIREGVLVSFQLNGLPVSDDICKKPIFAVHIHNGGSCTGNNTDPFADAMMHYNPNDCAHPYHAGDLPPIFSVDGLGFSVFLINRFSAENIIGKTIIIHSAPDDFTTQPSGNSGTKIACGVISSVY